jgi:uncharacterized protein
LNQPFRKNNPPLEELRGIFEKYPEIEAVYLFGSAAAGTDGPESDLDLAVYSVGEAAAGLKMDLLTNLARRNFCNVDIIFLDGRDIVLDFEAIKHNYLLYARPSFDKQKLYSNIVRKYFDFQHFLKYQRQALKERVLHG